MKCFVIEIEVDGGRTIQMEVMKNFGLKIYKKDGERGPTLFGTSFDGGASLRIYNEMGTILYKSDLPRDEQVKEEMR